MLLLDVEAEIESSKEDRLNEWYATHVPRLVSVPGYESGRRYVAMTPGPRHYALYEIRGVDYLASLVGEDQDLRDPLTLSEWAEWDRDLAPWTSHSSIAVYEPVGVNGPRLLGGDSPIVKLTLSGSSGNKTDIADWWRDEANPALAAQRDVLDGRLLSLSGEAAVQWLHEGVASHVALIECAGTAGASNLAEAVDSLLPSAPASISAVAYRPVARHWPMDGDVK